MQDQSSDISSTHGFLRLKRLLDKATEADGEVRNYLASQLPSRRGTARRLRPGLIRPYRTRESA